MGLRMLAVLLAAPALLCSAASKHVEDQVDLLQAELERSKKAAPAAVEADEDEAPTEGICQQLAGGSKACEQPPITTAEVAAAKQPQTPEVAAVPEVVQTEAEVARKQASPVLGYVLDALVVVLVLDGLRRWHQSKEQKGSKLSGKEGLMQAALAGDKQRFEKLLAKTANLNSSDVWGCTVLHAASKGGSVAIVKHLLDRMVKVGEQDSWDETPLHLAARAGHGPVCELLLSRGAAIDAKNAQDATPLLLAAEAGNELVCRFLLEQGASVAGLDQEEMPALLVSLLAEAAAAEAEKEAAQEEVCQ